MSIARQTRVGRKGQAIVGALWKVANQLLSSRPGDHRKHPPSSGTSNLVGTVISIEALMRDSREVNGPAIIASQPAHAGGVGDADSVIPH